MRGAIGAFSIVRLLQVGQAISFAFDWASKVALLRNQASKTWPLPQRRSNRIMNNPCQHASWNCNYYRYLNNDRWQALNGAECQKCLTPSMPRPPGCGDSSGIYRPPGPSWMSPPAAAAGMRTYVWSMAIP